MDRHFTLELPAQWTEIEQVRERGAQFLVQHGLDPDAVSALTMVACELTENAVKYGDFSTRSRVDISLAVERGNVTIEVKNPVNSDANELERLDTMIQWIRGHQDPFEAYLERLKRVSAQQLYAKESGLGLVRIAYEGQAVLDFFVNEEQVVAVSAVFPLPHHAGGQS